MRRSNGLIMLLGASKGERPLSEARCSNPIVPAAPENGTKKIGGACTIAGAGVRGRCTPAEIVGAVVVEAVAIDWGCDAWDDGSFWQVGNMNMARGCRTDG